MNYSYPTTMYEKEISIICLSKLVKKYVHLGGNTFIHCSRIILDLGGRGIVLSM